MEYSEVVEATARAFEVVGVAIIALGGLYALVRAIFGQPLDSYFEDARRRFGRPMILGLEILIAADIIETITVDRTLESVLTLGLLVLIRVVLGFSLDVEVEGIAPWRRAEFDAGQQRTKATDPT